MLTSTETGRRRSQIFCRMREFVGSREGDPCGFGWPRCAAAFYRNRRRRSNHVAKGSECFCHKGVAPTSRGARGAKLASLTKPRRRIAPLFDFGEKCVETLTPGVSIFGQPGLEQTQKTKSVVHLQRRVTPRALVQLMRDRCVQISDAMEYHLGRQIAAAQGNLYLACSALAASAPQRWRSSSSMSAGFSTVWATSLRNNQR